MADFTNSLSTRDSKFCERYKSVDNAYTATGTKTITISQISGGFRSGYVRVRTKSVNASSTNIFNVSGTDGSSTIEILPSTTVTAAGVASDITQDFHTDVACTTFTLTVTLAGNGNETVDFEVVGAR